MAQPKKRTSKTRGAKRRTHQKASMPQLSKDSTTGETHVRHRAHWSEGKLYYRGQVLIDQTEEEEI